MVREYLPERLQQIAAEDWLIIALAAMFIIPFGYNYFTSQDPESTADPEVIQYCEDVATAAQENATFTVPDVTCDCVPPGTFDDSQYDVAERVENATELFLVKCDAPQLQNPQIFPVRYVLDDAVDINGTVPNTTAPNVTTE